MSKYIGQYITIEPEAKMIMGNKTISWDRPVCAKIVGQIANRFVVELETADQHDGMLANVTRSRVYSQLGR